MLCFKPESVSCLNSSTLETRAARLGAQEQPGLVVKICLKTKQENPQKDAVVFFAVHYWTIINIQSFPRGATSSLRYGDCGRRDGDCVDLVLFQRLRV